MTDWTIRPIHVDDDPAVRALIHEVMGAFDCTGPGFAIHDPEVEAMSAAYPGGRSQYFVVEWCGAVAGGGGFAPLTGGDPQTAELRKMYFRATLRGRGAGRTLLADLLGRMAKAGYSRCYLETTSWMDRARRVYEAAGFRQIEQPMGDTGHGACDRFYLRELP